MTPIYWTIRRAFFSQRTILAMGLLGAFAIGFTCCCCLELVVVRHCLPHGVVQKTATCLCCVVPLGHNIPLVVTLSCASIAAAAVLFLLLFGASCSYLKLVAVRHFYRVGLCKRLQQVYVVKCLLVTVFLSDDVAEQCKKLFA